VCLEEDESNDQDMNMEKYGAGRVIKLFIPVTICKFQNHSNHSNHSKSFKSFQDEYIFFRYDSRRFFNSNIGLLRTTG